MSEFRDQPCQGSTRSLNAGMYVHGGCDVYACRYECDDSTVTRVAPEEIKTASAYVLFYRRVNAKERAKAQAAAAEAAATAGKAPNARQEDARPMPPTLPDVSSDDDDSFSDDDGLHDVV